MAPELVEQAVSSARLRANGLLTPDPQTGSFGLAMMAGAAMSSLWLDAAWDTQAARALADELCEITGAPLALIGLQALGNPELLSLPLMALASVQLEVLVTFADLDHASLWRGTDANPEPLLTRGIALPPDGVQAAAGALAGRASTQSHRQTAVITRWQRAHAVLVAEGRTIADAEPLLLQAAAMLSPAFERATLIERNVAGREALAHSAERRLRRLGFDLHDGPVQDVLALGGEISRLGEQLVELELGDRARQLLDGRLEDLRAYLCAIESDLREFCSSLESPVLVSRPFEEALHGAVWAFTGKCDLQPTVVVEGPLDDLTDSQRITLYRILQEALSNICDHSKATDVSVSLRVLTTHISMEIQDNGVGFDVDWALMDAARRGRIGLLGMLERVRLLGGDLQIESRPGFTRLQVKLAHWRPNEPTLSFASQQATA
ncbi:MAG TPA: ATP-binding protein [Solirubrobacteraceae bacterium]|nr:ATP-binding protein [Solirubrobacteraceae bacterium]